MKRVLCLILALSLAVAPALAQSQDRVAYIIPDSSKGLNSHISPYLTPENAAIEATNVRINSQFGSLANREVLVSEVDMGTGSVNGLHRYYKTDGNEYTIGAISTTLRYDASGTSTTIAQGLTDGKRFQFVTYKDTVIAGNGYDNSLKWDGLTLTTANTTGARTASDLCAELGAPFCQLLTGTHLDASSWYQYKVAFYDGTTYSYSTARSNPILTGAGVYDIRVTGVPIGPTGTTHRYIYRTLGNSSRTNCLADTTYYFVKDLDDNTTQTFDDVISDAGTSNNSYINVYVKSSVNLSDGDWQLGVSETASMGGSPVWVNVPALTANTWTRISVPISISGLDSTISIGANQVVDKGAMVFYIDDFQISGTVLEDCQDSWDEQVVANVTQGIGTGIIGVNCVSITVADGFGTGIVSSEVLTSTDLTTYVYPTWTTVSGGNNATPPKGSLLEICSERLFVSGNTTAGYQSDVYWSDDSNPDYFSPSALVLVRPDDGDKVTFLKTFLGTLTIGKTNTIQKFYTEGNPSVDWSLSNAFSFVGCPAPYTAAVTPLGIFYLGRHGLYRFSGQSSELISDSVTKEIDDISQVNIADCVGFYWNNEYHLAYASSSSSSATNNRVLVYDIVRNAYVVDTKNVNCFAAFGSGTDYGTLFSGSSTTDGYVFAHSPTTYTFLKRYKSELDSGTFSSTTTSGTEDNPTLSILILDNMESYTNNTLARASWISSETTASKMVPPDLGSGVDGSKTVSANESLTAGEYNYTDLTIDAGKIALAGNGTTIKCLGTVTINGTLYCGGTINIYAHTVVLGASGVLGGKITIKANTITNNGLISGDATEMGSGAGGVMFNNNWADTLTGSVTNTFVAASDITNVSTKVGCASTGENQTSDGQAFVGGIMINYAHSSDGVISGNNGNTVSQAYSIPGAVSAMGYGTSWNGAASGYVYEIQAYMGTPILNYANVAGSTIGTIRSAPTTLAASDTSDFVYALDVFSEATIINEAEYSLKAVIPPGADTLNETIAKTISDTDLSGVTYILVDIYASRNGTNMQLGLGEGALTDFVDIPVTAANTWETVAIDISGIANANIDHCTSIGIKFTNTDVGNVVYLDNIKPAVTSATWTSPVCQINAESLKKLYWNENLNIYGDVTWAIRTGATNPVDGTWSGWSATEYTNPNGSTITDTANTYIQFRATFTTSDTTNYLYPWLYQTDGYVFKINYSKIGANYETSVSSVWKTGWRNLGNSTSKKLIKRVIVDYEGESENLTLNIKGMDNAVDRSFVVDMSVLPDDDITDRYTGTPNNKRYTWDSPINSADDQSLISDNFMFTITHEGDEPFKVNRVACVVSDQELY